MGDRCETEWNRRHPAPFFLFQGEDGRWGTKDANGKIYDKPVYYRVEKEDGVIFNNGVDEAVEFDPNEGMSLICYCEPWWIAPFDMVKFPKKYNDYIFRILNADGKADPGAMCDKILDLQNRVNLTDEQKHAMAGLVMMFKWEDADDDDCDVIEEDWFRRYPEDRDSERRIAVLEPLMEREDIEDACKEAVWFSNFRFIYNFCIYS